MVLDRDFFTSQGGHTTQLARSGVAGRVGRFGVNGSAWLSLAVVLAALLPGEHPVVGVIGHIVIVLFSEILQ